MGSSSIRFVRVATLVATSCLGLACSDDDSAGNEQQLSPVGTFDAAVPFEAGALVPSYFDANYAYPEAGSYSFPDGSSTSEGGTQSDGGSTPDGGGSTPDGGGTTSGPCSGKPGAKRGKQDVTVSVGGVQRKFIYYAPASLDANKPVPLVISPHGFTMTGTDMFTQTGYKELADREGFVAIFPEGGGANPWNVGTGLNNFNASFASAPASQDDQGFIDAMIKYVEADQCLDKARRFISGFSMGGYFSHEVGCLRSDFAGIGPHSGGTHDLDKCPGSIKPVIIFHGDPDSVITYSQGPEARDKWLKRNGCSAEAETKTVKGGTCEYYTKGCKEHGQVAFCRFPGLEHAWAGGKAGPSPFFNSNTESAVELAWSFWKQYAW